MPGLRPPLPDHFLITQRFNGDHDFEPEGFLAVDGGGPRRARKKEFPNSVHHARLHGGIDIKCDIGTVIRAPERGKVVLADHYDVHGKKEQFLMLRIRPGTILFFTHLSDNKVVPVGTMVERGDPIALSGNSGMSTGPHLHWEVRVTGRKHPHAAKSSRWFKLNPIRVQVGGDLATLGVIQPMPGSIPDETPAAPVAGGVPPVDPGDGNGVQPGDPGAPVDADLDGDDLEEDTDPDDEFGDAAFAGEVAAAAVAHPGLPHPGGPLGHL